MSKEPAVSRIPLPGPKAASSMITVALPTGSENISERVKIASSFFLTSVCADPNAPVARTNSASTSHRFETDKINFTVDANFGDNAQLSMTISPAAADKYGPRTSRTPPQPRPRNRRSLLGALYITFMSITIITRYSRQQSCETRPSIPSRPILHQRAPVSQLESRPKE
jgi:hypothetical protein